MRGKLAMANALTASRMVLSAALLVPPALSPAFLALYAAAGLTDMVDGVVARMTGTASEFGARLDSMADIAFALVSLAKILPAIDIPAWLGAWALGIAVARGANVVGGLVVEGRPIMLHTRANKVAGLAVFLVPLAIPSLGVLVPAIPACALATFATVQESLLIRSGAIGELGQSR